MPTCDFIIPTHNNAGVLPKALAALYAQTRPAAWRVQLILSDDGSTDTTVAVARQSLQTAPFPGTIITNPHRGAAAARNRAIEQSRADIILLLGADILLRAGALAQHLACHELHRAPHEAALGMVVWDPRLAASPLMEWMTHGGQQNNYDRLLGEAQADPRHFFYGAHISLKRSVLAQHRFSEEFQGYGWEDLELGRRLHDHTGLQLFVLHEALGLHHHWYTVASIAHRQQGCGRSLALYQRRHPAVTLMPPRGRWPRIQYSVYVHSGFFLIVRLLVQWLTQMGISNPGLFKRFTAGEFWRGVQEMVKIIPS